VSEQKVNQCLDSDWAWLSRGRVHGSIGKVVLAYVVCKILARWHGALIRGEIAYQLSIVHLLTSTTCRRNSEQRTVRSWRLFSYRFYLYENLILLLQYNATL
jgi:hypothetical protein